MGKSKDPYAEVKATLIQSARTRIDKKIKMWLLEYGTLMSELTEDKVDLELSLDEEEVYQGVELTTGTYSVKMCLSSQIPQFLLMARKKLESTTKESQSCAQNATVLVILGKLATMNRKTG